jgi:hypothetical protein
MEKQGVPTRVIRTVDHDIRHPIRLRKSGIPLSPEDFYYI